MAGQGTGGPLSSLMYETVVAGQARGGDAEQRGPEGNFWPTVLLRAGDDDRVVQVGVPA